MEFKKEIEIRFSDQDSDGHVHHEAIVGYIAHTRVTFIDALIEASNDARNMDIDYLLVHLSLDFLSPIIHPGYVVVYIKVMNIGNTSLSTSYRIEKDDKVRATGGCVNVFYNPCNDDKVVVPDNLREMLERYETV